MHASGADLMQIPKSQEADLSPNLTGSITAANKHYLQQLPQKHASPPPPPKKKTHYKGYTLFT